MDEKTLEAAARRAYEYGRVRVGLTLAATVAPVAALAFLHCTEAGREGLTLIAIIALVWLVGAFTWRGQDFGRGVRAGLLAGLSPFLLPLVSRLTGLLCSATVCGVLPAACVAGGFAGGVALATLGLGPMRSRGQFWVAATCVTIAAGIVGCLHAGLAGLGGMALGLVFGTIPALTLRQAFRSR